MGWETGGEKDLRIAEEAVTEMIRNLPWRQVQECPDRIQGNAFSFMCLNTFFISTHIPSFLLSQQLGDVTTLYPLSCLMCHTSPCLGEYLM